MDLTPSSKSVFPWGLYALLSLWLMPQVSRKVRHSAEMYCGPPFEATTSGGKQELDQQMGIPLLGLMDARPATVPVDNDQVLSCRQGEEVQAD